MQLSEQAVRGAVARGWCHEKNAGKEIDVHLAEAIVKEVLAINRAQADARPCQYPNCGCDSRAKCTSNFNGAPKATEASAPGLSDDVWRVTDDDWEVIYANANASFRRHQSAIKGQQISPADGFDYHVVGATAALFKDRITRASAATVAEPSAKLDALAQAGSAQRDLKVCLADAQRTVSTTKKALSDLVNAVRWWGTQEDGIPTEVAPSFNAAHLALGWSLSHPTDFKAATQQSKQNSAHEWNTEGERCLKCGDKDWFAGSTCSGKAAQQQAKPTPKNCQTGYADICAAGAQDGVACPADSCDVDDGIRKLQQREHTADFDSWAKNPYTIALQKSIAEDYVPRAAQQQAEPGADEREEAGSLIGDGFVLEFERWNDVTGALPRNGSWLAEVSDIIQRAAKSGQREAEQRIADLEGEVTDLVNQLRGKIPGQRAAKEYEDAYKEECQTMLAEGIGYWKAKYEELAGQRAGVAAQQEAGLVDALMAACKTLPAGYNIHLDAENGWAGVELVDPNGNSVDYSDGESSLTEQVIAATKKAIATAPTQQQEGAK